MKPKVKCCRKLAEDDEFVLYVVAVFKRARDEFAQKAREEKYVPNFF
jgi:V-type H+-transporting ATPase subunit C